MVYGVGLHSSIRCSALKFLYSYLKLKKNQSSIEEESEWPQRQKVNIRKRQEKFREKLLGIR